MMISNVAMIFHRGSINNCKSLKNWEAEIGVAEQIYLTQKLKKKTPADFENQQISGMKISRTLAFFLSKQES